MSDIGLLAGNGQFPLLFARAARARGVRVVAVGLRGETEPSLANEVSTLTWVRVGQLRKIIQVFQRAGITRAAMAGGVRKTRLFTYVQHVGHWPDLLALRLLTRCAIRRDDSLLRAIADEFERRGIHIIDSTHYMPEALAPAGVLTQQQPSAQAWRDLRYGFHVAHEIGKLDIGQTVVIKEGAVVALEAMEGTDACIRRAGALTQGQGGVVVKVAKPGQDMRFDVPVVGPNTVASLRVAGISVLGIEAQRTLVLEPEHLLSAANRHGIAIVGLNKNTEDNI